MESTQKTLAGSSAAIKAVRSTEPALTPLVPENAEIVITTVLQVSVGDMFNAVGAHIQ